MIRPPPSPPLFPSPTLFRSEPAFHEVAEQPERVAVHREVEHPDVQEHRGEQPPPLAARDEAGDEGSHLNERVIEPPGDARSEEHTSELQSQSNLVCRLLLEK